MNKRSRFNHSEVCAESICMKVCKRSRFTHSEILNHDLAGFSLWWSHLYQLQFLHRIHPLVDNLHQTVCGCPAQHGGLRIQQGVEEGHKPESATPNNKRRLCLYECAKISELEITITARTEQASRQLEYFTGPPDVAHTDSVVVTASEGDSIQ